MCVWTVTGAACACTWPAALLKLRRQLVEKKEKFEERRHNGNGEERGIHFQGGALQVETEEETAGGTGSPVKTRNRPVGR